jgi:mRNA interferase MazF
MVVCPITNQAKGYPFEVALPPGLAVTGVILTDHVKSVDWMSRDAKKLGTCPHPQLVEVLGKIKVLLSI